jgi:hypothetical protein
MAPFGVLIAAYTCSVLYCSYLGIVSMNPTQCIDVSFLSFCTVQVERPSDGSIKKSAKMEAWARSLCRDMQGGGYTSMYHWLCSVSGLDVLRRYEPLRLDCTR